MSDPSKEVTDAIKLLSENLVKHEKAVGMRRGVMELLIELADPSSNIDKDVIVLLMNARLKAALELK